MSNLIEKINVAYTLVVLLVGGALIAAVFTGQKDIALAAVTGLLGFLGSPVAASAARKE